MSRYMSDAELGAHVRQRNRELSQRRRQKQAVLGMVQLNAWIPATLRHRLETLATERRQTLSDALISVLGSVLDAPPPPSLPAPPGVPVNRSHDETGPTLSEPQRLAVTGDKDALMVECGRLLAEGLSGEEIARRWNAEGRRTPRGSTFSSGNLLRDYRRWQASQPRPQERTP
jgi:hypothetical protein